jgi:hypothetical protein
MTSTTSQSISVYRLASEGKSATPLASSFVKAACDLAHRRHSSNSAEDETWFPRRSTNGNRETRTSSGLWHAVCKLDVVRKETFIPARRRVGEKKRAVPLSRRVRTESTPTWYVPLIIFIRCSRIESKTTLLGRKARKAFRFESGERERYSSRDLRDRDGNPRSQPYPFGLKYRFKECPWTPFTSYLNFFYSSRAAVRSWRLGRDEWRWSRADVRQRVVHILWPHHSNIPF